MPLQEPEKPSDDELRQRRLRDPQVQEIVRQIKRELAQGERSIEDGLTAEELPEFLREHG
jgi:hypothetical protein